MPGRQAFLSQMVERKEDLSNAIALNSSMFNAARLVGPAIAGAIIAAAGEGVCFLIDGFSYVAVIGALLAMRVPPVHNGVPRRSIGAEFKSGLSYVIQARPILYLLLFVAAISLVGFPYAVLLPAISGELLHGGAHTYGFLVGAAGLGALAGALYLAGRRSVLGLGRVAVIAAAGFGVSLVLVAMSRWVGLSLVLLVGSGFSMMALLASCNTIVQTIVEEDKRGRVMSFYTLALMGTTPFGSLVAGGIARWLGTSWTLIGGGVLCVVVAAWFARVLPEIRKHVRPIYIRLGILPEISSGLQAATNAGTARTE
jgi:MFS family permease